jgi:hypothetical protein
MKEGVLGLAGQAWQLVGGTWCLRDAATKPVLLNLQGQTTGVAHIQLRLLPATRAVLNPECGPRVVEGFCEEVQSYGRHEYGIITRYGGATNPKMQPNNPSPPQ